MTCVQFHIGGRVQGVGYRYFALYTARELGISGYVRNLPDGSVEVTACGDAAAVARFRECLREGPPLARVTRLSEQELAVPVAYDGFEIR